MESDPSHLNVAELKKALTKLGVDYSDCVEKEDLIRKLKSIVITNGPSHGSGSQEKETKFPPQNNQKKKKLFFI